MRAPSRTEPLTRWLRKGPLAMKTADIHTQTHAQTPTLSLTLTYETRPEFARSASSTHGSSVCLCVRMAAGGWQMLSAGSGRRLPVKHLLDTLETLLKRACVRDFAVVMKLSTASRTRVMDWTFVCVYDWMCLRVQRGRAGLRVTAKYMRAYTDVHMFTTLYVHVCIHAHARTHKALLVT